MTSAIDSSFIGAGNVPKAGMILALDTARDEISALQSTSSLGAGVTSGLALNPFQEFNQERGASSTSIGTSTYISDGVMAGENCATLVANGQTQFQTLAGVGSLRSLQYSTVATVTTAQASYGAGELFTPFTAVLEGYDAIPLAWGTSDAFTATFVFVAKSTVSGTYCFAVRNAATNRSFVSTFALVANTAKVIVVVVGGDASGTWNLTNGVGMYCTIGAVGGTSSQAASLNTWVSTNTPTHSTATNWPSAAPNSLGISYFNIFTEDMIPFTDASLLIGVYLRQFLRVQRPYATELARCQRYWWNSATATAVAGYTSAGAQSAYSTVAFPVAMRAVPAATPTWSSAVNAASNTIVNIGTNQAQARVTSTTTGVASVQLDSCVFNARL